MNQQNIDNAKDAITDLEVTQEADAVPTPTEVLENIQVTFAALMMADNSVEIPGKYRTEFFEAAVESTLDALNDYLGKGPDAKWTFEATAELLGIIADIPA